MEENIEETETTDGAGITEQSQVDAPAKKRTVTGLIRDMWPAYLIEIFVIILGISVSLALEQWRDNSREAWLENIYLKNLLADVEVDIQSLKNVSASTREILSNGNELLGYARNPEYKDVSYNRVAAGVRAILGRPKFFSSDATFSDLKSSGNLHLLKDIQLKNLLFSYYSQAQNIKELQDAEQQATITLSGSYFLKRFPIDDLHSMPAISGPDNTSELLKNFEFDNNVLLRVLTRKELLEVYQMADKLAADLKAELMKDTGIH